jgi:hypothetical protein
MNDKATNSGPSVATNMQELWYDCSYMFEVVSEEFWSGLLGEEDSEFHHGGADTNSLADSLTESQSLITEDFGDDEAQYKANRRRQKMWRSYRRRLQLAK